MRYRLNARLGQLAVLTTVVVAGAGVGFAGSSAASIATVAADEVFNDPPNDNPNGVAPDLTRAFVSLGADEVITIRIETPNRTGQLPTDAVVMYLNTDLDTATGAVGSDFRIESFGGDPGVFLARWSGSSWDRVTGSSFVGQFSSGVTATVHRRDLGGTRGFSFFIASFSNGLNPDYMPDDATGGGRLTAKLDGTGPGTNPPPPLTGSDLASLVARVRTGVIRVETTTCAGKAVGSGTLISSRLVATVEHVVAGARAIVLKRSGKTLGTATVIGRDRARDLALLRLSKPVTGHKFRLATRLPDVGEAVAALGFPLGLPLTATRGTVSGLNRTLVVKGIKRRGLIQTDAAVNRGNSGGPLLSIATGEVLGLVDLLAANANGIAFAVSSKTASSLLSRWAAKPLPVPRARCR